VGVEARGGEYDVRRNLMSMNELLRNSIAGDQSGIQLLPGVGVASAESAVISRLLLGCYRRGCANSTSVGHQKTAVSILIQCCPKPRFSVSVRKP